MVYENIKIKSRNNADMGLSSEQVNESRKKYGENRLTAVKRRSFLRQFASNLGDPVIRILLGALVLNLLFLFRGGDIYETVGIGISVFLATFISTLSEYKSETAFSKLSQASKELFCHVRRDGCIRKIPTEEIVVGDIIILSAGEKIPADCILLSGSMAVDQSAMTGESREVQKTPYCGKEAAAALDPSLSYALLGGCNIVWGEGEAKVAYVGDSTFIGGISTEIQQSTRESPLRLRLTRLASTISRLGYVAAILVAVAYLINSFILDSGFHSALISMKLSDAGYIFSKLLHAFTLGLTVIVVAVPEGLPMMIAVVLSANIKKMIRDNVLVRKPAGIEAAGSMNILFTDKTGTLTEGKLSVKEYILGDGSAFFADKSAKKEKIAELFALSGIFNTSSKLDEGKKAIGGNMTDRALLSAAASFADRFSKIKTEWKIPFDSEKKFSAAKLCGAQNKILIKG
ncbi:MAG: cation-transporting P-type ATPase, partial [Clostridia bacterium]|nr:cation-transporting P-type ATPase [Clostridia bacterium]